MNNNEKKYQIALFGKTNCDKCSALKKRVSKLLENNDKYSDFYLEYFNISTLDGLCEYANAETINGQRIPGIQIRKYSENNSKYEKVSDPRDEQMIDGKLFVPVYLQLETDYSDAKRSVIKNESVKALMDLALEN